MFSGFKRVKRYMALAKALKADDYQTVRMMFVNLRRKAEKEGWTAEEAIDLALGGYEYCYPLGGAVPRSSVEHEVRRAIYLLQATASAWPECFVVPGFEIEQMIKRGESLEKMLCRLGEERIMSRVMVERGLTLMLIENLIRLDEARVEAEKKAAEKLIRSICR